MSKDEEVVKRTLKLESGWVPTSRALRNTVILSVLDGVVMVVVFLAATQDWVAQWDFGRGPWATLPWQARLLARLMGLACGFFAYAAFVVFPIRESFSYQLDRLNSRWWEEAGKPPLEVK